MRALAVIDFQLAVEFPCAVGSEKFLDALKANLVERAMKYVELEAIHKERWERDYQGNVVVKITVVPRLSRLDLVDVTG